MILIYFIVKLEKLIEKNYFLNMSAKEAYKAYIRSYASHSMKAVYDVNTLDVQAVAKSFGFHTAPYVDLGVSAGKKFSGKRKAGAYDNDGKHKKAKIYRNVSKSS
jgi:ATP-dependent RNA helicase DDX18/HAS1